MARAESAEWQRTVSRVFERGGVSKGDDEFWRIQQRYEDYLRSSIDWVWECDADLILSYVSAPVALTLGIPAQMLKGRHLLDLGQFEDNNTGISQAEAAIRHHRPFRNSRFVIRIGDRTLAYSLSGVAAFDEPSGQFIGYRGTAVAIMTELAIGDTETSVERKLVETLESVLGRNLELEAELAQKKDFANRKDRDPATESYLARLAHELRTPLNAITGYAELAARQHDGELPASCLGYLRNILTASRHLETLLTDLDSTDHGTSEEDLENETIDVADALQEAQRIVGPKGSEAGVDLSLVGPIPPWRVRGDRRACIQILVNLLNNSVKYTPEGGSVGAEAIPVDDETLEIKVWDTGIGIPEGEQERVFQSNYRADHGSFTHRSSGRGLGLAIVRDLARAMKGDIRLESMAGTGSCFILRLPLVKPEGAVSLATWRQPGPKSL